ncbi:MAG: glutamate-semialdehyde -aminomutase [Thermoleophilaceae bacterium]|jgi:glutamate-1-semialdehyde 2,1-aminomutase|nr:glutamate-semialdehyde -aminomutase [Thermoleophilaceae bacterium]
MPATSTSQGQAAELRERALRVMPGGVTAGGRFNPVLGRPYYFDHGNGARLWDVDGNEYLDYSSSNGASMLGHNHPRIAQAVRRGLAKGTMCTQETRSHVELCERLCELIPSAEKVRLSNTGTEATMAALRIARAATGRDRVLKFDGHFHGMHDYVLFNCHTPPERAGDPEIPPYPDSAGIPSGQGDLLVNIPFNDPAALTSALDRHGDELACVILEPISYNLGCVPADRDFLALLREETAKRGIVLIFDEVLSGFRMGLGGAQEHLGVEPDLSTWAKALGAGWPIAAVTGSGEVMDVLGPVGGVVVSGTYTGQLCSVMAAIEALDIMSEPGFYDRLNSIADGLYRGLESLMADSGVTGRVQGIGARFGLYFGVTEPVRNYEEATAFDAEVNNRFLRGCVEHGLHFHDFGTKFAPMHYGTTSAHTDDDVDLTLERLADVFAALGAAA